MKIISALVTALLILVSNVSVAAELVLGVGHVNYTHDTHDRNTTSYLIGFTTDETYPWYVSFNHVPTYNRTGNDWRGYDFNREAKMHNTLTITKRLQYKFENNLVIFGGLGIAAVDNKNEALSSHLNFHEEIGIKYKYVSLVINHSSNAGLKGDNLGEDIIFLNWNIPLNLN